MSVPLLRTMQFVPLLVLLIQMNLQAGRIETLVGNGVAGVTPVEGAALAVPLSDPFGVVYDAKGDLYFTLFGSHCIYRYNAEARYVERIAGTGQEGDSGDGGPALAAKMNQPHEIQIDSRGIIYIADTRNHRIRYIDPQTKQIFTLAGTGKPGFSGDGGPASRSELNLPHSIALDGDRKLYIADIANQRVRVIDLETGLIATYAGTGEKKLPEEGAVAEQAPLLGPRSLAVDRDFIWLVLREGNSLWKINKQTRKLSRVAGSGKKGYSGDGGLAIEAELNGPKGVAVDTKTQSVYLADTENHSLRRVDLRTGVITTVAGLKGGTPGFNGDGMEAAKQTLKRPHGVCISPEGDLIVGDSENHRVRKVALP